MLKKVLRTLLLVLGILVAFYIKNSIGAVPKSDIQPITKTEELQPRSHMTIITDIIEFSAKNMLKLSKKGN